MLRSCPGSPKIAVIAGSDEQLMVRIADQDTAAFAALYDRYAPRLLGYLTRLLRDEADAEDVLQTTMLQVWRKATLYDPARARAAAWLYVIARSRATDVLRRRRHLPSVDTAPERGETADLDAALRTEDVRADMQRAMRGLPENQRSAIRLAFYAGLTHAQVAERLDAPLGSVKTWIRRGMSRLRSSLEGPQEVSA